MSIRSGSRSATASPDRSEDHSLNEKKLLAGKDGSTSEPESCLSSDADLQKNKEVSAERAQQERQALLKEQAQRKEIKTCKEKMLKHR